ncbi:MAG TPA: DUF4185 domain-containing protein, partial [Candidatus Saccharimonadales bacterium]|nr:DUF4185 domain-containing protein [Candidatus Saccharimonadales bacterium]
MHRSKMLLRLAFLLATAAACELASAQTGPALTWITNSSVKLEQIIGDYDWADLAVGITNLTASQTVTRFHILGNGLGYSFEDNGKLIFLFGDTMSEDTTTMNYHAADPLAWSTNTDGETPLLLNFFTNTPPSKFTPLFVQPSGIKMGPDDVPNSGISLSNGNFLVCNTGSDSSLSDPQTNDYSVLVTFYEDLAFSTNTIVTNIFVTNRTVSVLSTNIDPKSPLQGHFIFVSMREYGANVMMFGAGEYRSGDVFLCMIPTANFVSGNGTLYFAGLTNGQPMWSSAESNCVPVVQDNPTNGPAWPNDAGTVGNVSVIYSTNLNLWLMTYDGGRSADTPKLHTTGVYFSCAPQPWGPWSTPQLIFNRIRDGGYGVFIYNPAITNDAALAGPVIGDNIAAVTAGGDFAPIMIERFTRVTNGTLFIYYTMSTWNPYTVVKMRSAFTITPVIDPGSLAMTNNKFSFAWSAPTNGSYQVDYSTNLLTGWMTFTNIITSTNGAFNFTDDGTNSGGAGNT